MRHAKWPVVDYSKEHNIVWIEDDCDANSIPKKSITNDAENVIKHFSNIYGNNVRVVYRDSMLEYWEIVWSRTSTPWQVKVDFRPWHGMVWTLLNK